MRLCGKLSCFGAITRSVSGTHGSGACTVPTLSQTFSGQKLEPEETALCRCLPSPGVRKRQNLKSLLSRLKVPSIWMERKIRKWIPHWYMVVFSACFRFSQKVFWSTSSLGLSGFLVRQHCTRRKHSPCSPHTGTECCDPEFFRSSTAIEVNAVLTGFLRFPAGVEPT